MPFREAPPMPRLEYKEVPRSFAERCVKDFRRKTKLVPDIHGFELAMKSWKDNYAKWEIDRFDFSLGRWAAGTCGPNFRGPQ